MLSQLDLTLGAVEVGVLISTFLMGIATLQTWNYYRQYPDDPLFIKAMVAVVFIMDVAHSALVCHALYFYTVTMFGQQTSLGSAVWTLVLSVVFHGLIAFVVQTFFCVRLYRLTKSKILSGFCWTLAIVRLITVIIVLVDIWKTHLFAVFEEKYSNVITSSLAMVVSTDVITSGSLVIALWRSRTGFAATDKLIDKIMAFLLGSGLLTSLGALGELITLKTMANFVWLAILIIIVKIFTNSLLASLNERKFLRNGLSFDNQGSGTFNGTESVTILRRKGNPMGSFGNNVELDDARLKRGGATPHGFGKFSSEDHVYVRQDTYLA